MTFRERLNEDLKKAIRARDERWKTTIRLLLDAIHKAEIPSEKEAKGETPQRKELSEGDILQVAAAEVKKRREAIVEFERGGREDLVAQERAELEILLKYLPPPLTREEIVALAKEAIESAEAKDSSQMGLVMKQLMPKVQGRADGKLVSDIVRELLSAN